MEVVSEKDRIEEYAKDLKISVMKNELDDFITLGTEKNWTYITLLCQLLSKEVALRTENKRKQRIRRTGFSELKYLQELVREELSKEEQLFLPELETLYFTREG